MGYTVYLPRLEREARDIAARFFVNHKVESETNPGYYYVRFQDGDTVVQSDQDIADYLNSQQTTAAGKVYTRQNIAKLRVKVIGPSRPPLERPVPEPAVVPVLTLPLPPEPEPEPKPVSNLGQNLLDRVTLLEKYLDYLEPEWRTRVVS